MTDSLKTPICAERSGEKPEPYDGYYFRILTAQGPAAPGGAFSYLINGHMIAGHAMVAWPAAYGDSGVETFICGENGVVYQKDLGPNTAALGALDGPVQSRRELEGRRVAATQRESLTVQPPEITGPPFRERRQAAAARPAKSTT